VSDDPLRADDSMISTYFVSLLRSLIERRMIEAEPRMAARMLLKS